MLMFVKFCKLHDKRGAKDVDVRWMLLTFLMSEGRKNEQ
jgi:hypothetical protein